MGVVLLCRWESTGNAWDFYIFCLCVSVCGEKKSCLCVFRINFCQMQRISKGMNLHLSTESYKANIHGAVLMNHCKKNDTTSQSFSILAVNSVISTEEPEVLY